MDCPDCDSPTVAFVVPEDLRNTVPGDERAAALCTRCLALHPVPDGEADADPDFGTVSEAFPSNEAALPMALAVGLLDSLTLYRTEIEGLLERVEGSGTDPLLVLDRLAADPTIDPRTDLGRRRGQVEQFRE